MAVTGQYWRRTNRTWACSVDIYGEQRSTEGLTHIIAKGRMIELLESLGHTNVTINWHKL